MIFKRESPNLDILRSFAVIAVLVNHLAQITPWGRSGGAWAFNAIGRAGVLIFFVHTALVLMGSLERLEARGGDTHLLRAFYIQRICRLYPLSIACVTAVLLVHFLVPAWHLPWVSFRAVAANLALVQNLTWDPSAIWPLWSLPYEVQMYVVLPFIYLMTKRRGAMAYVALLWVVTAAWGSYQFASDPRYLVTPYQYPISWFVPTFLGGVFAFILLRQRKAVIPALFWPVLILGIFVVFQMVPMRRGELAMTLLGFAIPQFRETQNAAIRVISHQVAKYSYGIYLLHAPLLELCFVHLHRLGIVSEVVLFVSLLSVCSIGAYHLIEKPMIDVGHRVSRRIAGKRRRDEALVTVIAAKSNVRASQAAIC